MAPVAPVAPLILPKSCVEVLLYVNNKFPLPLTVAVVIPLPVAPVAP